MEPTLVVLLDGNRYRSCPFTVAGGLLYLQGIACG